MKLLSLSTLLSLSLSLSLGGASPVFPGGDKRDALYQKPIAPAGEFPFDSSPPEARMTIPYADNEPDSSLSIPSWPTTHLLARRLLGLSTTGVLSTVFPRTNRDPALVGVPIGLPDYFANCDDNSKLQDFLGSGNPLVLALNLGTSFRNTKAGSNISLSVDWWQHAPPDEDGDLDKAPAAFPRLSLIGWLEPLPTPLPDDARHAIEQCFLTAHPDAKYWLPGDPNAAHRGYWARLVVVKALWIGGFGDRARIGWLDIGDWRNIRKHGKSGERGWADVRLPGEEKD
ncbi:hypothetical protein CIHG_08693 [Coccidioides immitis H538.4]|uniref:CREG-like beta-barrel domain-containing protein n=1 Tax=Coccidioides immitis H538.4 TaxID=396776 RepID=A0A0J8USR8_COCIT|nr:hypothetical protein CIHG_08693 [Coccidioides immitis H538.4]